MKLQYVIDRINEQILENERCINKWQSFPTMFSVPKAVAEHEGYLEAYRYMLTLLSDVKSMDQLRDVICQIEDYQPTFRFDDSLESWKLEGISSACSYVLRFLRHVERV